MIGLLSGPGLRLVRRGLGVRQLYLLRGGHAAGHRREGQVAPPRCAGGDVHDGAKDTLAEGAREEEAPDVVGAGDGVRSPEAEVRGDRLNDCVGFACEIFALFACTCWFWLLLWVAGCSLGEKVGCLD